MDYFGSEFALKLGFYSGSLIMDNHVASWVFMGNHVSLGGDYAARELS